jgi:hypothetical protein
MAVATEYGKEALLLQSTAMNANEEALLLQSTAKSATVVFLTGGAGIATLQSNGLLLVLPSTIPRNSDQDTKSEMPSSHRRWPPLSALMGHSGWPPLCVMMGRHILAARAQLRQPHAMTTTKRTTMRQPQAMTMPISRQSHGSSVAL